MIYICKDYFEATEKQFLLRERGFDAIILKTGHDFSQNLFYKRTGLTLLDSKDEYYIVITIDK